MHSATQGSRGGEPLKRQWGEKRRGRGMGRECRGPVVGRDSRGWQLWNHWGGGQGPSKMQRKNCKKKTQMKEEKSKDMMFVIIRVYPPLKLSPDKSTSKETGYENQPPGTGGSGPKEKKWIFLTPQGHLNNQIWKSDFPEIGRSENNVQRFFTSKKSFCEKLLIFVRRQISGDTGDNQPTPHLSATLV